MIAKYRITVVIDGPTPAADETLADVLDRIATDDPIDENDRDERGVRTMVGVVFEGMGGSDE